jgi:hypothetical protein
VKTVGGGKAEREQRVLEARGRGEVSSVRFVLSYKLL